MDFSPATMFPTPNRPPPRRPRESWSALPDKDNPSAVSSLVNSLFEEARAVRRQEEAHWYVDLRYLAGDQWVVWNPQRCGLQARPNKPWRLRQTINHYRVAIEILQNTLLARRPRSNVIPGSSEPEDVQAARGAEALLKYLWHATDTDGLLDPMTIEMLTCGKGILKASWDPDGGPVVEVPLGELPPNVVPGPGFRLATEPMRIGELALEHLSIFSFVADPAATRMESARWCGSEHYVHVDEARARFPDVAKQIGPDAGRSPWLNYQRRLMYEGSGQGQASSDVQDTTTFREIYFRQDGKWPQGRKIVLCGSTVCEDVDNPFDGAFPYVDFTCYPNPGSFWPLGAGRLIRNPQTSLNRARSWWMEMLLKHGNPQWAIAKGAGVSRSALNDEPGNVVYYNPVTPDAVRQLPGQQPPPGWNQLMEMDLSDLRELAGVVDVMRGVNPPGVRSGRSLNYLIEQNLGRHGPLMRRFERSVSRLGRLELQICQKFYAEDRMLQILGGDGAVEVYSLKATDLRTPKDVVVVPGSAFPESRAGRQDLVMQMFEMMLVVDGAGRPDPRKALKLMEITPEESFFGDDATDKQWAHEENERMAAGEAVEPEPHDNSEAHAEIHVAFMRTARYRKLQPEYRALIRGHLDKTIGFLMASGAGESSAPGPSGAKPPGGGGGPDQRGAPAAAGEGLAGGIDAEPRTDNRGGPE